MGVLLISGIARTLSANVRHWSGCRRLVCLGLAACATAGTPAGPQDRALTPATAADPFDLTRVPPRPPLPATDADTNSARAYLRLGLATLDTTHYPEATAAEAFYWAARLDPGLSAGYYLRWAAISLALANPTPVQGRVRLVALSNANRARLDSLRIHAYSLNPMLDDRFEFRRAAMVAINLERRSPRAPDTLDDAFLAFATRDYARAASEFGTALHDHPEYVKLHFIRAHAFYFAGQLDSALAELQRGDRSDDRRDATRMMQFYAPREMFAYAIGFIEQGRHNLDLARAAFDHALHQNGALYMGQVHLAEIAFAQGDTSAVIQDFETALRVQPRDVIVHTNYGSLLSLMGHRDAAVAQLDTAVRLDPDFATPYWLWAHVLDARGDTVAALQKYHEFLHHAPEEAVERPDAIVRILALTR